MFANAIETSAIKLPELQDQYKNLQNEIQDRKCQKQELERDVRIVNSRITELTDVEKMHRRNFDTLADKICDLQNQKHQLEQFVSKFKNSNKQYLKIKSIAEEVVKRLLTEQESLLDLALKAVVEALRMGPNTHEIIFNNSKYDNDGIVFDKSGNTTSETYQEHYYNKYHEGLVELAKGFLKILLNQLVDKTMAEAARKED
jgi:chromosome segregation ATPase